MTFPLFSAISSPFVTMDEMVYFAQQRRDHTRGCAYACTVCLKTFNNSRNLSLHLRNHRDQYPYVCSVCYEPFKHVHVLTAHLRVHRELRVHNGPYMCSMSDRIFNQSGQLSTHIQTHLAEKPHKCSTCGKSFKQKGALNVHLRIHTGGLPYVCSVCDKAFTHSHILANHMRIHSQETSQETSHTCNNCWRIFRRKCNLNVHKEECNKSLSGSNALSNHIETHEIQVLSKSQGAVCPQESSSAVESQLLTSLDHRTEDPCLSTHAELPGLNSPDIPYIINIKIEEDI